MIISNLLTKYILASVWTRLLIFTISYFIIRELSFMNLNFSLSSIECMQEASEKEVISAENEHSKKKIDSIDTSNLENIFMPLIAESKNMILQEIKEYLEERLSTKLTENVKSLDIKLARLENRLMQEIDKSDCQLTTDVNLAVYHIKEGQKSLASIEFVERSKNKILAKQESAQTEIKQSLMEIKAQIQASQSEFFTLRENLQEQISTLRQETHASILEVNSKFSYEHEDSTIFLRNRFDRKLDIANNEILDLKTQNQELQRTVMEQVAEAKNQQDLIDTVRKSFEKKMTEKDKIIKALKDHVATHEKLHNVQEREIKSLRADIDRLLHRETACRQETTMLPLATTTETRLSSQIKQAQAVPCAEIKQVVNLQQETKNQLTMTHFYALRAASK